MRVSVIDTRGKLAFALSDAGHLRRHTFGYPRETGIEIASRDACGTAYCLRRDRRRAGGGRDNIRSELRRAFRGDRSRGKCCGASAADGEKKTPRRGHFRGVRGNVPQGRALLNTIRRHLQGGSRCPIKNCGAAALLFRRGFRVGLLIRE
jgi:hypothetical protein